MYESPTVPKLSRGNPKLTAPGSGVTEDTVMIVRKLFLIFCAWGVFTPSTLSYALFEQTERDLEKLEQDLRYRMEQNPSLSKNITPMLVSTPTHHWVESRNDFSSAAMDVLGNVFEQPGDLVECAECDTHRLHVEKNGRMRINNGPLSLLEYQKMKKILSYRKAKSVVTIKETESGVVVRIVSIKNGRILYFFLADSSQTLKEAQPWLNFAKEYDRRKRAESLSFVRINFGLYPTPLVQIEFAEQWGSRNQHMTGLAISLVGPIGALGLNYHYLLREFWKTDLGVGVFFPLQNIVVAPDGAGEAVSSQVYQVMASWMIGDSYGVFVDASFGGESTFTFGVSFYNPVFLPFLL